MFPHMQEYLALPALVDYTLNSEASRSLLDCEMVASATVATLDIIFWFCRGQRVCSCAAFDRSCNGAAACGSREALQRHLRGVDLNLEASSDPTSRQLNTVRDGCE